MLEVSSLIREDEVVKWDTCAKLSQARYLDRTMTICIKENTHLFINIEKYVPCTGFGVYMYLTVYEQEKSFSHKK